MVTAFFNKQLFPAAYCRACGGPTSACDDRDRSLHTGGFALKFQAGAAARIV
jgi:hypothetical protein